MSLKKASTIIKFISLTFFHGHAAFSVIFHKHGNEMKHNQNNFYFAKNCFSYVFTFQPSSVYCDISRVLP